MAPWTMRASRNHRCWLRHRSRPRRRPSRRRSRSSEQTMTARTQATVSAALMYVGALLLTFIFTTCSSICPLASRTLEEFQRKLGPQAAKLHLMSISIDPEEDTPARLRAYARKFHAGPEWQYYTGTVAASLAAQKAFDVYRGEKMSHTPVTLLRSAPGKPWLRIEGFVTPDELVDDYQKLLASP